MKSDFDNSRRMSIEEQERVLQECVDEVSSIIVLFPILLKPANTARHLQMGC